MEKLEKLTFITENNEPLDFYIIEETRVNGTNYLLVTDSDDDNDDEAGAFIMKDTSAEGENEAVYEFVEDETEFESVSKIFETLLEDSGIELE